MKSSRRRFRRFTPVGLVVATLLSLLGMQAATGTAAHAATNQFHGVNWADPSDNFITGNLTPVGLSNTDSYSTTYAKSTAILKGFQALGANTVRMPFNQATVTGSWWNSYTAAFDAATALDMKVVLAPWRASCAITSLQGNAPNYTLSVTNQSGLDRIQYGWGTGSTGSTGSATGPLHAVGAGKCLDVPSAVQTNGTVTQIWDCNAGSNQTWTHTASNQLTVYGSAKCLDANGNQTTAGTAVVIWDCNGGANQQWILNANGTITGVQSGLCLDVTGASTANSAKIELWTCTGQSNQQWKLG